MADFVAVVAPTVFAEPGELKRLLLLFERLAIDLSAQRLSMPDRQALRIGKNDLEYLSSEGLLTTLEGARADARDNAPEATPDTPLAETLGLKGLNRALRVASGRVGPAARIQSSGLRALALTLRRQEGLDAVAVGEKSQVLIDDPATRQDVIRITLRELPVPSELTPWETVSDFRRDPDSKGKHMRLKAWINKVSKQQTPIHELEDELQQLLFEYQQFMHQHKVKTGKGVVEVLVTTPAEIAEDILKFKWGKLAKAPFELAREAMSLYAEERNAPGREVAYIIKAMRQFSSQSGYFH